MLKITQEEIIEKMAQVGMIPVFNHTDIKVAINVLDACYAGGVRVFEFTNRGSNALDVFTSLVEHSKKYNDLILGIGTIFSEEKAEVFFNAGAQFIVSPAMIPEMGRFCKDVNTLWVPGCGTVTEIHQAKLNGAKMIKAFPGNVLGPGFVKSVKAVFPDLPIMPTGGVAPTRENLKSWFDVGVTCVGMGSKLITQEIIRSGDYHALQRLVKSALLVITNNKR